MRSSHSSLRRYMASGQSSALVRRWDTWLGRGQRIAASSRGSPPSGIGMSRQSPSQAYNFWGGCVDLPDLHERHIAVFCGSRPGTADYRTLARDLGLAMAQSGATLIYGGGRSGLMEAVCEGIL